MLFKTKICLLQKTKSLVDFSCSKRRFEMTEKARAAQIATYHSHVCGIQYPYRRWCTADEDPTVPLLSARPEKPKLQFTQAHLNLKITDF